MGQASEQSVKHPPQPQSTSARTNSRKQLTCQQCQTTLSIKADNTHRQRDDRFHIQCPCGMQYEVISGSRRYSRKQVQMPGIYQDAVNASKAGEMAVESISFGGLRLRTKKAHAIAPQDCLYLQFVLDDGSQTGIVEPVKVRYVKDNDIIGASFINADAFTPALAAYLIR